MKSSKKILASIIISNFNKASYLKNCLDSCIDQNFKNIEIIVCDDYSTDNSIDIIKKYKNVILIKNKCRKLLSAANNQINCLRQAYLKSRGNIVFLLDSDDYFERTKVKTIVNYFYNNPKFNFLQDRTYLVDKKKRKKFFLKKNSTFSPWPQFYSTSTMSFKRKHLNYLFNKVITKSFIFVEIDTQIFFYHYFINSNNYKLLDFFLTNYRKDLHGIMSGFPKFSFNWWQRRLCVYKFLFFLYKKYNFNFKIQSFGYNLNKLIINLRNVLK
jgi:glycosyltransferase involved in cell wall biosynthesis